MQSRFAAALLAGTLVIQPLAAIAQDAPPTTPPSAPSAPAASSASQGEGRYLEEGGLFRSDLMLLFGVIALGALAHVLLEMTDGDDEPASP